jgi:hypothetical protein
MVHALREVWRVLRPDGILIDLRPAIEHCRIGIVRDGHFTDLGRLSESFDGSRAANRAVAHVLGLKLFRMARRTRFECEILFSSPRALREWIADYGDVDDAPSNERLVQRAELAIRRWGGRAEIAARIPFVMKVLLKQAAQAVRLGPATQRGHTARRTARAVRVRED